MKHAVNLPTTALDRDERTSAKVSSLAYNPSMFRQLFERSADAMFLSDPHREIFVDCNEAAVAMMRASSKLQLLQVNPADLSPEFQPDGRSSRERVHEDTTVALRQGSHRFEWRARRMDGAEFPVEVLLTPIQSGERMLIAAVCRDITERKASEAALRESEAKFRELFEASADAISILDPQTRRFVACNESAVRLAGANDKSWILSQTADGLAPERQPDGRLSTEVAQIWIERALAQGTQRFEWMARRFDGEEVPMEILLTPTLRRGSVQLIVVARDISERKQAERELFELNQALERRVAERTAELSTSEAKYRALFEGASQGVVVHDENQMLEVNPATVRILGRRSAHELLGKHPGEFSPPFQPNGERSDVLARKHIEECMTRGSARFDWLACEPSGRGIFLEVNLTRIEYSGREVIQAFITDITERKRTEAALAESEARFSAAFHESPISTAIARASDAKFVLANDAFLNWAGYDREEMIGHTAVELGMWEDAEERKRFWDEVRSAGSVRARECRLRNRAGKHSTMLASGAAIAFNGEDHLMGIMLDISQRKQGEAELRASEARMRESEARFSAAFHASPAFISIVRMSDAQYVLANDLFLSFLGYPLEDIVGRTCNDIGLWESQAERDSVLRDMQTRGSIRQRECHWRNRAGERCTILLSAETIQLNDTPHMLAMAVDITRRKRAEDELLKTLDREKELSRLKSSFVSMVSHEFRTPLGIIQSSAELLRDFYQKMPPGEREDHLDSISRNTRRMAGMMEEVLVLSRLDAGKLNFQPAALDLNVVFRRIVDEVLSATSRRCPIELSLNSIPTEAQADERLLGHIFTNLLSNAVKYSEAGIAVHFLVTRDERDAVCVIRDKGIGIPEEDRQQLFKAFHRGSNVGTRPGTGLGLLLVKRCTDLHGASVQVESQLGEGTTVSVRFSAFGVTPSGGFA